MHWTGGFNSRKVLVVWQMNLENSFPSCKTFCQIIRRVLSHSDPSWPNLRLSGSPISDDHSLRESSLKNGTWDDQLGPSGNLEWRNGWPFDQSITFNCDHRSSNYHHQSIAFNFDHQIVIKFTKILWLSTLWARVAQYADRDRKLC